MRRAGVIYLTATRDGERVVYRVNPNGTGLERLGDVQPDEVTDVGMPAFSVAPNGKRIAFVLNERLYYAAPDGSDRHPESSRFGSPSTWSPDGKFLAWSSLTGDEQIDVGSADGKSVHAIPLGAEGEPAWSPKGDVIAISQAAATGAPGAPGIYTVRPNGTERKPLATGGVFRTDVPISLNWSPDASQLAVVTSFGSEESEHIYVVDASAGKPRRLTSHIEQDVSLAWSPDGSRIAFSSKRGKGPSEVYVIRRDGSDEHRVTRSTGGESSADPQWSLNGSWLAYVRARFAIGDGSSGDIYLVRPSGTGAKPLLRPSDHVGEASEPVWASMSALPRAAPAVRSVRSVAVSALYTLSTVGVGEITARAASVAVEEAAPGLAPEFDCGPIVLWTPRTGRTVRGGITCHPGDEWLDSLSLVGLSPAWNFSAWDRSPIADCTLLWAPTIASPAVHVPYETLCAWPRSWLQRHHLVLIRRQRPDAGQIVTSGTTLLYNSVRLSCFDNAAWLRPIERSANQDRLCRAGRQPELRSSQLWRLEHGKLVRVPVFVHLLVLDSFDGTLVAGRASVNRVVVSRLSDGRVVARHSFSKPVTAVRVQGRHLAVQSRDDLTVFDLATGRSRRFHLARVAGTPKLTSLEGGLVSYVSGPEIHLVRLADARDITLKTPQAAEPVDAELTSSGFFYSYNVPHVHKPGRVSFIPLARLVRMLG